LSIRPDVKTDPLRALRYCWMLEQLDGDAVRAGIGESHRLENPKLTTVATVGCASCHWAGRARRMAEEVRTDVVGVRADAYANPSFDLAPTTGDVLDEGTVALPIPFPSPRAFGYLDDKPVVLQRVVHESAEVAEQLNGR
jgi:hypothetical protein